MNTLVIITQPPYQSRTANEQLETIMSLALFDVPHRVVFLGQGLLWLLPGQQASTTHSIEKQLQALPMYGSEDLHYIVDDKAEVLSTSAVSDIAQPINRAELVQWMKQAKHVEVF